MSEYCECSSREAWSVHYARCLNCMLYIPAQWVIDRRGENTSLGSLTAAKENGDDKNE